MSSPKRYFDNSDAPKQQAVDAHAELLACLELIDKSNPPVQTCSTGWKFYGFYAGPTSIAFLFWRLSQMYPELVFKNQSLRDWADAYLELGSSMPARHPEADDCGIGNEDLARIALSACMTEDASLVNRLCSFEPYINASDQDGSNEWLYGRAGYLYHLRLCRHTLTSQLETVKLLDATIEKTVLRMVSVPQPWRWRGKRYLGAAHGTIGAICQAVMSRPSTAELLEDALSDVLDQQFDTGNMPSSIPAGPDRLVQFCHGGPGLVLSLQSLYPHFRALQPRIQTAIYKAQEDVWRRGLLTKKPSLCHGIAGNALALGTDEQMKRFMSFMSKEAMERVPWWQHNDQREDSSSLYIGAAGRAWCWAVVDKRLPMTCIGYNDV